MHFPTVPSFSAFSQESQQKDLPSATLQSQPLWAHVLVSGIVLSSLDNSLSSLDGSVAFSIDPGRAGGYFASTSTSGHVSRAAKEVDLYFLPDPGQAIVETTVSEYRIERYIFYGF